MYIVNDATVCTNDAQQTLCKSRILFIYTFSPLETETVVAKSGRHTVYHMHSR